MHPRLVEPQALKRYVLPVDQVPLLDDAGFLLPPSLGWTVGEGEDQPQLAVDLVEAGSSFALLAAGGAGKSTTFAALETLEPGAHLINAAFLRRDELDRKILASHDADVIYLDGLDQAAGVDEYLLQWLEERLTEPAARRTTWRLACRSAAWRAGLSVALRQSGREFREWKLLPLDRAGSEQAVASQLGPDFQAGEFIAAVADARLGTLSACVGQLLDTARYWQNEGELPAAGIDAMKYEIGRLVRETSDRRERLSDERKFRIAERLGALLIFAREQTIAMTASSDTALGVAELPHDPEPLELSQPIEIEDYREVLGTALFDSGPPGTVVFRHQRYPEFLAAAYLAARRANREQIADLVGVRPTGALPASMINVVTWLAAFVPDRIRAIISDNAAVLAVAADTIRLPDGAGRAAIVEGLIEGAARDEIDPDWSIDLASLTHSALESQLTAWINNGITTSRQLWWVARLGGAGGYRSMAPALAAAAHNTSWTDYARRAAVLAVGELGDDTLRQSLTDLLHPGRDIDTDNEVLAAAIEVLYPRDLTTEELLGALRPHASELIGGYYVLMHRLTERISNADLVGVLDWFASAGTDGEGRAGRYLDKLFQDIVNRGWELSDDRRIRVALARVLATTFRHIHERVPLATQWPWTDATAGDGPSVNRRRALALSMVDVAAGEADICYILLDLQLLTSTDVGWLLDYIESDAFPAVTSVAACVPLLVNGGDAALADRILSMDEAHPAYALTSGFRGAVDLSDPYRQQERERRAREYQFKREEAERQRRLRVRLEELISLLNGEVMRWWEAVALLTEIGSPRKPDEFLGHDLTQRSGWAALTTDQQQQLLEIGVAYLRAHHPRVESWWGSERVAPDLVEPDWFGVQLMTTLLQHRPDLLAGLDVPTWQRWAPAIVATWTHTFDPALHLRGRLLEAVPRAAWSTVIGAAFDFLDAFNGRNGSLRPREVVDRLVPEMRAGLSERLRDGRYRSELAVELLDLLIATSSGRAALAIVRELSESDAQPQLAIAAAERLATLDPSTVIERAGAAPPDSSSLARILPRLDITTLNDAQITTAARLLLDAFPYADDPPWSNAFVASPQFGARRLRSQLLEELAARGAVDSINSLAHNRPDADRQTLGHYLVPARRRRADLDHQAVMPRQLFDLLSQGDARLVRDDASLLEVLVQQLDQLQDDIRYRDAFRDLWNEPRQLEPTPKGEDDISDWIRRWLEERLNGRVLIDREAQVRRPKGVGIGTRIDLTLTGATGQGVLARVLVEAKRVDNRDLLTAMRDQLIERYLIPAKRSHGLFLVYWVDPGQRRDNGPRSGVSDVATLTAQLDAQARVARDTGLNIVPFVLDISRRIGR